MENAQETEQRYQDAVTEYRDSLKDERVDAVRKIFEELGDYKDSAKYAEKCRNYLKWQKGNHIEFGSYNGEPVRWTVLEALGRERLLFADHVIDYIPYNKERDHTNWSDSDLRHWLNKDFLEKTFSLKERMQILLVEHQNNTDPRWSVENGPATRDKAFVFNLAELDEYVPDTSMRAVGDWWWLRGYGSNILSPMAVYNDGTIYTYGVNKNADDVGVRPAIWVRLTL